ncbi:MAG TPA: NADPH:quinone oxidoreductase family protein [Acidimicrobiales bacterium]|nr:NADPH:quinone oxidoreductase family protein [Acidimicrobiales bacterium]
MTVARAWRVNRHGVPADVLAVEDVDVRVPGPGEVRVAVDAMTLNFNDIDGVYGRYRTVAPPLPFTPGMEVVGRVEAAGPGGEELIGRRVAAIPSGAFGGYASLAVCPVAMTFDMPDTIALPEAAAILMPFHLAWLAVHERGRLQAGETLLVHAAAGGAGSAALQLGVAAGATVIAVVGSAEKAELCRQLGAHVAVDQSRVDFVEAVLDATRGRGADIAFDSVGGTVTERTFRCMAFNGRHLLVGFASGIGAEDEGMVPRPILFGNFSLAGVCLAYVEDPLEVKRLTGHNFLSAADAQHMHARILDLVHAGRVRPIVHAELPFEDLPAGLAALEARETTGRVVVRAAGR